MLIPSSSGCFKVKSIPLLILLVTLREICNSFFGLAKFMKDISFSFLFFLWKLANHGFPSLWWLSACNVTLMNIECPYKGWDYWKWLACLSSVTLLKPSCSLHLGALDGMILMGHMFFYFLECLWNLWDSYMFI